MKSTITEFFSASSSSSVSISFCDSPRTLRSALPKLDIKDTLEKDYFHIFTSISMHKKIYISHLHDRRNGNSYVSRMIVTNIQFEEEAMRATPARIAASEIGKRMLERRLRCEHNASMGIDAASAIFALSRVAYYYHHFLTPSNQI